MVEHVEFHVHDIDCIEFTRSELGSRNSGLQTHPGVGVFGELFAALAQCCIGWELFGGEPDTPSSYFGLFDVEQPRYEFFAEFMSACKCPDGMKLRFQGRAF